MSRTTTNPRKRPGADGRMTSDAAIRRAKLQEIDATGSTEGMNARSVARFWEKGYLEQNGAYTRLTRKGRAVATGKIGAAGRGAVDFDTANRAASRAGGQNTTGGHAARAAALYGSGTRKETKAERMEREAEHKRHQAEESKQYRRILPGYALKIALSDGSSITREHLDDLTADGWQILPAGTVPAKVGRTLAGQEISRDTAAPFWNPEALGPTGKARAVIVWSHHKLDRDTVESFRAAGWDISSAPKRYREEPAPVKNPNEPMNEYAEELRENLKKWKSTLRKMNNAERTHKFELAQKLFDELEKLEKEHFQIQKKYGRERKTTPNPRKRPKKNPSAAEDAMGPHVSAAARLAVKKAAAFFGRDDLVKQVREIHIDDDVIAAVEIGGFIALEYDSHKFDGKNRVYRHETDVKRKLYISTSGDMIFVIPPFKVTKRGIEG